MNYPGSNFPLGVGGIPKKTSIERDFQHDLTLSGIKVFSNERMLRRIFQAKTSARNFPGGFSVKMEFSRKYFPGGGVLYVGGYFL